MHRLIAAAFRGLACATVIAFLACRPEVARAQDTDFQVGIGVHLYGMDRPEIIRQLNLAAAAGFNAIRMDVPWRVVEKRAGSYKIPALWDFIVDSAKIRGIDVLMILDYGNPLYNRGDKPVTPSAVAAFAKYAAAVAGHFRHSVRHFEIWNEWNGPLGNTTIGRPEDYIRLIAAVYPKIKASVPGATVIVGATSGQSYQGLVGAPGYSSRQVSAWGFFARLLDLGMLKYGDAISVHPYTMNMLPQTGIANSADGYFNLMKAILAKIESKSNGKMPPVYVTEVGWVTSTNSRPPFVSEDAQAAFVPQSLLLSRTLPDIAGVFVYELKNAGNSTSDPEMNYGITRRDGTPKPAYLAVKNLMSLTGQLMHPATLQDGDAVRSVTLKNASGIGVNFVWTQTPDTRDAVVRCGGSVANLRIVVDGNDQAGQCNSDVTLSTKPIAIIGNGTSVVVKSK
jgi:hypothetical protein